MADNRDLAANVTSLLYNSTAPAPSAGTAVAQQGDQSGNTRVFPGLATLTLSGWTSGTSVNATQTIYSNSGAAAALVHLVQTSTISAGAITFEVSYDNSNWVTIPADAVIDPSSTTLAQISLPYTLVASTNKPFLINNKGWQGLRIKLSTAITGSATVTPNYALLPESPAASTIVLSPTAANFNVTVGAALPAGTSLLGRTSSSDETSTIYNGTTAITPKFAVIDAATSGDNTLVASVSSKKIRVLALFLVAAGTVNARFESGAGGTALTGQMNLVANSGFVLPYNPVGWFETAVTTLLNLELSAAISCDGSLTYVEV